MTPAARLRQMQDDLAELYTVLGEFEGNAENVRLLQIALVDVMAALDMAVNRARRV